MRDVEVRDLRAVVAENHLVGRSALRTNLRLAVLGVVAVLAVWAGLTAWSLPVLAVAVVALTLVAASLHQAVHEAWHGNLYRSVRANAVVGTLLVTPLGLNYALQRLKHHHHHAFVGTARDPIQYKGKPDTRVAYLLLVLVAPFFFAASLWLESLLALLGVFRPEFIANESLRRTCRRHAVLLLAWSVASWALLLTWPSQTLVLYVLPVVLMGHVLMFMGFPQHDDTNVDAPVLETVRTVRSGPGFSYVIWNGNYHAEHHVAPKVPFYALPAMHDLVRDDLVHCTESFWAFHRGTLRRLRAEASSAGDGDVTLGATVGYVSREIRELGC